jgi:hypothetical protein
MMQSNYSHKELFALTSWAAFHMDSELLDLMTKRLEENDVVASDNPDAFIRMKLNNVTCAALDLDPDADHKSNKKAMDLLFNEFHATVG